MSSEQEALWEGDGIGMMDGPARTVKLDAVVITPDKGTGTNQCACAKPVQCASASEKGARTGQHPYRGRGRHTHDIS